MMSAAKTWKFSDSLALSKQPDAVTLFCVAKRARAGRFFVAEFAHNSEIPMQNSVWFVRNRNENLAQISIGDAPNNYHARYIMAILSSRPLEISASAKTPNLADFPIPEIEFSTSESVRRSMTLNSMRMSLEYFADGSLRVLDLVENRLREGQRDIVHDLCVYLMRHLLDIRARDTEARMLRAEAVAAFLGLELRRVQTLFLTTRPNSRQITQQLRDGFAGEIRRKIDIEALLENQVALLRPQIRDSLREEMQLFALLDQVVARLYL